MTEIEDAIKKAKALGKAIHSLRTYDQAQVELALMYLDDVMDWLNDLKRQVQSAQS